MSNMLYDLAQCPHRPYLDVHGDPAEKDTVSPFVQLLWDKGHSFEKEVMEQLKEPFTDLSPHSPEERESLTSEAMARGDDLIYAGRIRCDDLLGDPDILRKEGSAYAPGDIKSGAGFEGSSDVSDGKPKKHYAVQLALYTDILERKGLSASKTCFVWDIHGDEVTYDLDANQGSRKKVTWWEEYEAFLAQARTIVENEYRSLPALGSGCKQCHWQSACKKQILAANDLTLIFNLGRAKRDDMMAHVATVKDFSEMDISTLCTTDTKTVVPRVSVSTLHDFQDRARLLSDNNAEPYLKEPVELPKSPLELFFDIETDPMRGMCYLHAFVERRNGDSDKEKYVSFFADGPTPEMEEQAFSDAWEYVRNSGPCVIYYYSHYERTIWRKLQERYPSVASENDIQEMYGPDCSVDLYDVVKKKTEWPTSSYSLKPLAVYLGFKWRDTDPSGAASIEWYHRWVDTADDTIKQRILEYNEDDCRATRVLLDGIRQLQQRDR